MQETEASTSKAREVYRLVAARGALLYFLVDSLPALDRVYHYSMARFVATLQRGMDQTPGGKDESQASESARGVREAGEGERWQWGGAMLLARHVLPPTLRAPSHAQAQATGRACPSAPASCSSVRCAPTA